MRISTVAILLLAALALGACGSSNSTTTTRTAGPATATAPTTTPTTPATTPTTPATTTSASRPISATPRCTAASLALTYLGGQGATGHGELGFSLRNKGSTSCHTFGYPGVLFLGQSGQALPTVSTRTTHDFFGSAPEVSLLIAPGSTASFRLGVTHGINSSVGCLTAYALQVIPPDDTSTLRTAIPQGGAYECGTATVSPLRPGTSAYP